jgi:hypothetical protein
MSMNNINGRAGMIAVSIGQNGTVALLCTDCHETWAVSYRLSGSPFWEVFIGSALLTALAHYQEAHA